MFRIGPDGLSNLYGWCWCGLFNWCRNGLFKMTGALFNTILGGILALIGRCIISLVGGIPNIWPEGLVLLLICSIIVRNGAGFIMAFWWDCACCNGWCCGCVFWCIDCCCSCCWGCCIDFGGQLWNTSGGFVKALLFWICWNCVEPLAIMENTNTAASTDVYWWSCNWIIEL